jgi:hypothetical protein
MLKRRNVRAVVKEAGVSPFHHHPKRLYAAFPLAATEACRTAEYACQTRTECADRDIPKTGSGLTVGSLSVAVSVSGCEAITGRTPIIPIKTIPKAIKPNAVQAIKVILPVRSRSINIAKIGIQL